MSNLLISLSAAFQAAISVELTLFYGYVAAACDLLDNSAALKITSLSTRVFLPCLVIVQCGPELDLSDIKDVWIIFVWSFATISFAFFVGWAGRNILKLPGWTVTACAINNANAMPLLMLQSLSSTSALDGLAGWRSGESSEHTIARAKTYVLLYMVVQQVYGFLAGPPWLKLDRTNSDADEEQPRPRHVEILQDAEHVGLLDDDELHAVPVEDPREIIQDIDDLLESKPKYPQPPKLLMKILSFFNPPIVGALVALFFGIIPPLHNLLLDAGSSLLYPSVTTSLKNLGDLFTSIQMFTLGAQLYHSRTSHSSPGWRASLFVLSVRFLIMPAVCIASVYGLVTLNPTWLRRDPMLWFVMMVSPSGPSALLLASFAELVHTDQSQIAAFLFISYLCSPLIAVIVSVALEVIHMLQS